MEPVFNDMLATDVVTVTNRLAVCPPSVVLTEMVAVPFATAVISPVLFMVAILGVLVSHETAKLFAFAGIIVANA